MSVRRKRLFHVMANYVWGRCSASEWRVRYLFLSAVQLSCLQSSGAIQSLGGPRNTATRSGITTSFRVDCRLTGRREDAISPCRKLALCGYCWERRCSVTHCVDVKQLGQMWRDAKCVQGECQLWRGTCRTGSQVDLSMVHKAELLESGLTNPEVSLPDAQQVSVDGEHESWMNCSKPDMNFTELWVTIPCLSSFLLTRSLSSVLLTLLK